MSAEEYVMSDCQVNINVRSVLELLESIKENFFNLRCSVAASNRFETGWNPMVQYVVDRLKSLHT